MIIILDPKKNDLSVYRTLTQACKEEPDMSYSYLKRVKLSNIPYIYKGKALYRIKHS